MYMMFMFHVQCSLNPLTLNKVQMKLRHFEQWPETGKCERWMNKIGTENEKIHLIQCTFISCIHSVKMKKYMFVLRATLTHTLQDGFHVKCPKEETDEHNLWHLFSSFLIISCNIMCFTIDTLAPLPLLNNFKCVSNAVWSLSEEEK